MSRAGEELSSQLAHMPCHSTQFLELYLNSVQPSKHFQWNWTSVPTIQNKFQFHPFIVFFEKSTPTCSIHCYWTSVWTHFRPLRVFGPSFKLVQGSTLHWKDLQPGLKLNFHTKPLARLVELNWTGTQFMQSLVGTWTEQQFQAPQELELWTEFFWKRTDTALRTVRFSRDRLHQNLRNFLSAWLSVSPS